MFSKRAEMTELRRQLTQLRLEVAELSTRVAAAEAGMQDIAHHVGAETGARDQIGNQEPPVTPSSSTPIGIANPYAASASALSPLAIEALRQGRTIEAIKIVRQDTGLGLKDAKDLVDRHLAGG